jgi:hypothetical protein
MLYHLFRCQCFHHILSNLHEVYVQHPPSQLHTIEFFYLYRVFPGWKQGSCLLFRSERVSG